MKPSKNQRAFSRGDHMYSSGARQLPLATDPYHGRRVELFNRFFGLHPGASIQDALNYVARILLSESEARNAA